MNTFVLDIFLEKIRSEYPTLEQELMISFERVQNFRKGTGNLLDFLLLFDRQFVQINIARLTRIDLVADAIYASHKDCRESQIRITGWVWRTEFHTFGIGIIRCGDTADRR